MRELRFVQRTSYEWSDPQSLREEEVLKRAIGKIVVLAEEVGVSTDQMIQLLKAGLSVEELLEFLVRRKADVV